MVVWCLCMILGLSAVHCSAIPETSSESLVATSTSHVEKKSVNSKEDDAVSSSKNTLADQVAMGKYGLIQKELFSAPGPRPGVLSYTANDEVPRDLQANLGGLDAEDIWLAEDHLLVLRGGRFEKTQKAAWPPIDDYQAPARQVKIPKHPAVPPPFPVQLRPGGPLEFIGHNGSRVVPFYPAYATPGGARPPAAFPGPQEVDQRYPPGQGQGPHYLPAYPGNFTPGQTPFPIPPFPFPPPVAPNYQPGEGFPNVTAPQRNITDLYDEDDPSVYYPPPYSFYYPVDDSKLMNAGPLVPGIILPPPPDFFAPLNDDSNNMTTPKPTEAPAVTKSPVDIPQTYLPVPVPPRVEGKPFKSSPPRTNNVQILTPVYKNNEFYYYNGPKHAQIDPAGDKRTKTTLRPVPQIGKLKPVYDYYEVNTVTPPVNSFKVYGPPNVPNPHPTIRPDVGRTYVSSTAVPLRSFYEVEGHNGAPQGKPVPQQFYRGQNKPTASFFFYEEPASEQPPPAHQEYYDKRYFNSPREHQQFVYNSYGLNQYSGAQPEAPHYVYNGNPPERSPVYYRVPKPLYRQYRPQPPPPRQSTFRQQLEEIQKTLQYYTTQSPRYVYRTIDEDAVRYNQVIPAKEVSTSRPVYQYSFNAVGYEDGQKSFRNSRIRDPNSEPFRPMLSYNVPLNPIVSDAQKTKRPVYDQYPQVTSETPLETKYVQRAKQQHYEAVTPSTVLRPQYSIRKPPLSLNSVSTTPDPRYSTANPLNSNYYTNQDEGLFDEITKKYFTIFGQKLYNKKESNELGVTEALRADPVTTPIPPNDWLPSYSGQESREVYLEQKRKNIVAPPSPTKGEGHSIRNQQQSRPAQTQAHRASLETDTYVNYLQPRPGFNADSEFVPIDNPRKQVGYGIHRYKEAQQLAPQSQQQRQQQQQQYPVSLARDVLVNYKNPRPPLNPNAEIIAPEQPKRRPGAVVSYDLPGDGAHVYFVTPQRRSNYYADSAEQRRTDRIK